MFGNWTNPNPKCLRPCGFPPIQNGKLIHKKIPYQGNEFNIHETRIPSGTRLPNEAVECNEGYDLRESKVMANLPKMNLKIQNENFESTGKSMCYDGKWVNMVKCSPIPCPRPASIQGGYVRFTKNVCLKILQCRRCKTLADCIDSMSFFCLQWVQYQCYPGYRLVGKPFAICNKGKWVIQGQNKVEPIPVCEKSIDFFKII